MAKKRSTIKPQGTLEAQDVTNLYLALWGLRDAIASGDMRKVDQAELALYGCIPCTTTNDGARTRARNIRRKQEELEQAAKEQPKRRFDDLSLAERQETIDRLYTLVMRELAPKRGFEDLTDGEQVDQLKAMWGEA